MKRSKMFLLALALVLIFGFYGIASADGGAEGAGCNCDPWPQATGGQQLKGDFTVALNKELSQFQVYYYDIHVTLKKGNQTHLYSRSVESSGKNICDYTASELKDPINGYGRLPCLMGVGEDFGMTGVPVITDLKITNRDFCGEKVNGSYPPSWDERAQDAMISGEITIRFAPVTCP